jgi:hypothetical protein
MSTQQDKTISHIDSNKVFIEKDGSLYLIKRIQTFKFLMVNQNGDSVYEKTPFKTETLHVTPESLGYSKHESWDIYVYKVDHSNLEDKTEFYSMTLNFQVPDEKLYKTAYFKKVKSGRVFLMWFNSGTCSEVSINDNEFCKREKARKLPEDTLIQKNAPIFTLSSSGELERRLDSDAVW